jgi:hypothetical protein
MRRALQCQDYSATAEGTKVLNDVLNRLTATLKSYKLDCMRKVLQYQDCSTTVEGTTVRNVLNVRLRYLTVPDMNLTTLLRVPGTTGSNCSGSKMSSTEVLRHRVVY